MGLIPYRNEVYLDWSEEKNVEAMRADFKGALADDPDSALKRFEEARAKWAPAVSKAVTATGLDVDG